MIQFCSWISAKNHNNNVQIHVLSDILYYRMASCITYIYTIIYFYQQIPVQIAVGLLFYTIDINEQGQSYFLFNIIKYYIFTRLFLKQIPQIYNL